MQVPTSEKSAVGSILHPHLPSRLSCLPSCLCSEWAQWILPFARPWRVLGSLCEHMCAEKARCLGMIWLCWLCGLVRVQECTNNPLCPPPLTHTYKLQLPSRLMFNQSMGFLWLPDYSINRWAPVLTNFTCVDEFLNRSAQTCINRWLFLLFSHTTLLKWNNLLSHTVHELITDSYKSTPSAI